MKRFFILDGLEPAMPEPAQQFLRGCDLGINAVYRECQLKISFTIVPGTTPEQILRQAAELTKAFEAKGWKNIELTETDSEWRRPKRIIA